MEYKLEFNSSSKICTIHISGKLLSPQDSIKLQHIAAEQYSKHKYRLFLIDLTQAEIITQTMSAFETGNPKEDLAKKLKKLKGAFLYSEITSHENFFENVAVNRGFKIKVFDKHEEAAAWLKHDSISTGEAFK